MAIKTINLNGPVSKWLVKEAEVSHRSFSNLCDMILTKHMNRMGKKRRKKMES